MSGKPERPLLVTLNGKLFDVSRFASKHPGGKKVLQRVAGGEISEFMEGRKEIIGVRHEHSSAAYEILQSYSLEGQAKKDELFDLTRPMLWKIGDLKEKYWTWIHQPSDGVLRLFDSEILERLTRTKWWLIPVIWLPIVIYFIVLGFQQLSQSFGLAKGGIFTFLIFILGSLAWTLLEYSLHRGLFHWQPDLSSNSQITLHFLLHGLHHKTPMDPDRLVFPPVAAALIIGTLYGIYRALLPYPVFCCFASGKLFGYICYDLTHYYLHHGSPIPSSMLHQKKVYHHNHHFKDSDSGFGISTMLWDFVFGTVGSGPLSVT